MGKIIQFITWPVIAGLLAAYIILDRIDPNLIGNKQNQTDNEVSGFALAVDQAAPAVVNIYTTKRVIQNHPWYEDPVLRRFLGRNARREERVLRSLGSGVIMNAGGYKIGRAHV